MLFPFVDSVAQAHCSGYTVYGTWRYCGRIVSSYERPPVIVDTDSLMNTFTKYKDSVASLRFNADGTCEHEMEGHDIYRSHFLIEENSCVIEGSSRNGNAKQYIIYLSADCMILWHNNPKAGFLTVYRR